MEDDAVAELAAARADDLVGLREAEGDEQQPRLVDVQVVAVDDVDLRLVGPEAPAQPVGGHRPAGPAAEDDDAFPGHVPHLPVSCPQGCVRGPGGHPCLRGAACGRLRAPAGRRASAATAAPTTITAAPMVSASE